MAKLDVNVVIELKKASPRASFGIPLIFAGMADAAVEYTEVGSLADVVAAGFAAESAVYKAAQILLMQDNAPKYIAVCGSTDPALTALPTILDKDWRQLIVASLGVEGESTLDGISDYIESCGKPALYYCKVDPEADATALAAMEGNSRTIGVVYASDDVSNPEAALVGATAGLDVGSITYKNIVLKGVTAQTYADSEVTGSEGFHSKGLITYQRKAGDLVTSEGITLSGEYIDIIDAKDYIIQQIEYQSQKLLNRVNKLPYDNRGIASLESVVVSVLLDAATNGMIATKDDGDYDYTVYFAPRSECADADVSTRHYDEGTFEFALAGAIHTARIHGQIIA